MAKVSEVINEVITRFVVDDQTAQPTESAGARIDALQEKSDALAESGKRIGESYQEGFETAGSAANRTVEAIVSGTGKLETSAGRLKDSVDQITHDVQLGTGNTEKALSGVGEASEDTVTSADKIGTSFKDSLSDATKSAEDLVTVITRSATSADKTWQNSAARTGDSISKIQRQIRLAQDEYDRLDARGVEAIGSGSTSPEDVTRVLDAQREKIDSLVQQEAKLRLEQTATAETFTKMGEDGSSASAVLEKLSAAEMAEVMSLRELRSAFENNLLSLNGYRKGVQDITADYAAMQRASDGALSSIASSYQSNLNSNLGISLPSNDLSASRLEDVTGAFADADAIRAKIVPLAAAERDYASAIAVASDAHKRGVIDLGEYLAAMDRATASYQKQKDAIAANVQAQQEALRLQRESVAAGAQEKINTWAGVSTPEYGQADSRQEDFEAALASADATRAKLVPLAAAEQDYAKAVAEADAALKAQIIDQAERDAYVDKATDALNRQKAAQGGNAAAVKLTSFEMGILADETHKFFDQVLAGGSPLQAAFYQVPNMVQVMGGLDGALTRVVSGLSGPAGLAIAAGAAGAAILGVGKYAESEQESLAQLSTHLRATRADYNDMATSAENAAREQSILADEWHASTSAMSDQTQALDKANAAYADGSMSAQDAASYVSAYTDAENSFQKGTPQFVQAMQERISAAKALTVAQQNTQMIGQTNQNNDQVAILQTETSLIGSNDDARQKLVAHMEVEQQLYRQGIPLTDEYAQKLLASTDALSDATVEYQHQQQVMDDFTGSISDMADQLSDGVVQGFMQGTSSGMSFKSMLQGVDASVASVIARFALINPLMNALDGKTRTTLADIGNLFSETGSEGSSSSGSSSFLSSYGTGNDITSSGWAYSPWEALNMKNQASSPSSGSAVNAGAVSAAPSALENLFSGKAADGSGIFSSFGSAVSSIGSYMGMAGAAFGIGEMAYNLLSPLFAKREKDYQYVSVDNGQLGISGHVYKDIHNNDNVASGLQSDLDSINNAFDYTGVSATNTDTIGKVGWSKKGKKSTTYSLTDLLPDLDLTSSDATMQQELKQLMPSSFDSVDTFTQDLESLKSLADELDSMKVSVSKFDDSSHVTVDHFTGYTGDMAKALSTLDGGTYSVDDLQSKFEAIEEFVGTTMPGLLDVTASGSESLMQQVDDLKQKYQDAANTAASYGLDAQALLDKGNAIAAAMIANEQTTLSQSDQSVQARYLSATGDQEGADLLNQQVSAAQEIQQLQDNWRSFLGDNFADNVTYQQQLADLEKTQNAERLQIQQEYQEKALEQQEEYQSEANEKLESVFDSLDTYEKGLTTSDASPLSVADQYKAANDNLHTDYQAALGGNYDALSALQTDMQTFLSLSQKFNGGGAAYVSDFNMVQTIVKALGGMDLTKVQTDVLNKIQQEQSDGLATLASLLQDLLKTSVAQLQETRFQAQKDAVA